MRRPRNTGENWWVIGKKYEPSHEKTKSLGFQPGLTQTGLCCHRSRLEAWNFGFRTKRICTIRVTKTKVLIRFAVTAKLICVFVFAYADCWFSHEAAHLIRNSIDWTSLVIMNFLSEFCQVVRHNRLQWQTYYRLVTSEQPTKEMSGQCRKIQCCWMASLKRLLQ